MKITKRKLKNIKEYQKEYLKEYKKEYLKENKEYKKEYYENHKKEYYENKIIERAKEYLQTPKGREINRKTQSKRRRNLEWNPLNEYFENSEGHHINKIDIIYIPKNWHFKGHSVIKNKNMEPINTVAFLIMQNIDRFQMLD